VGLSGCQGIHKRLLQSAVRSYTDTQDWETDDLLVFFGGTGVLGSDTRAGSSVAIVANQEVFLFDCGPGSTRVLQQGFVPLEWSRTVFLTHLHSDHFGDLGELTIASQLEGRTTPLTLYGPEGVAELASGFETAYGQSLDFRIAQHPGSLDRTAGQYRVVEIESREEVLVDRDGIRITAFPVDHQPVDPAFAYKLEYGGRTVVISGDTSHHSPLAGFAQDADLLIHEAMDKERIQQLAQEFQNQGTARTSRLLHEAISNHSDPGDAGALATEASVHHLVLTHIAPPLVVPGWRRSFVKKAREQYSGPTTLAEDGMMILLEQAP